MNGETIFKDKFNHIFNTYFFKRQLHLFSMSMISLLNRNAIIILISSFMFFQMCSPVQGSNKATWQELERIGLEFAQKVTDDEAYRSIAIAALWESILKDSISLEGAKTLLHLFNGAEKADIEKVTSIVELLIEVDNENEYEYEKIFSNILWQNEEIVGSILAMERAINTGKATDDEILSFVRSVRYYEYDALSGIPVKALVEDLAAKNNSEAYRMLASFNERDPNLCKKYLLSALQYAKSDNESSSALASLLTYPIELSEDERMYYKKLRFKSRMKTWDDAIDDLDGVFRSLLNAQDYESVIELWLDEDVKPWHEGKLSREFGAIFGRRYYAQALLSLGNATEALEQLELARYLCKKDNYSQIGHIYRWEAQSYLQLDDKVSAKESITKALELFHKCLDRTNDSYMKSLYEKDILETEALLEELE